MGFLWSKPIGRELKESLIENEPQIFFRTGDILLAEASEMEISLNSDIWTHVAIIVKNRETLLAYSDGEFAAVEDWIYRYDRVVVRHCHCARPVWFDKDVLDAANETTEILIRNEMDIDDREGFCVASVLSMLGLVSKEGFQQGPVKPDHFSGSTPFDRLNITEYSQNYLI
tara:strand:- start:140 stop:652 length:513 start_codon:yes stop_codon:yes gene_type:complete